MENELDEASKKNANFNEKFDRLLEATLANDVKNCVVHSFVEIENENLREEVEKISKECKDVQENLLCLSKLANASVTLDSLRCSTELVGSTSTERLTVYYTKFSKLLKLSREYQIKRIVILENDFQRCQAQSIAFKLELQHQKEKNVCKNSWMLKVEKLYNENVYLAFQVKSLTKANEHLKLEYQKLFDSIKKTQTQTQREINELSENVNQKTYAYGDFKMELDIENMTLNEYLMYQGRHRDLEKSCTSRNRIACSKVAHVKYRNLVYPDSDEEDEEYYRLPPLPSCFQTPQPCAKFNSISHNVKNEIDIDSMTLAEYDLYMAMQCSMKSDVHDTTHGFTP
ncbi:hypothetical protein Tco_0052936 [Tanacetum coccineum]